MASKKRKKPDYSDAAFPALARFWEAMRNGYHTNREIIALLEIFAPNSGGTVRGRSDCTFVSARDTVPQLCRLMQSLAYVPIEPRPIQSACSSDAGRRAADELAKLFTARGSDKATEHEYHLLYGEILAPIRDQPVALLEIGLGTNNTDVVSNMGRAGKPGASLRAFRDFLPRAQIFGADLDRRILFAEERIATYYVDQTDERAFRELDANLEGRAFDLIIDDGLHAPNANLTTLAFALERLKPGGYAVIEDIYEPSLPVWALASMVLASRFDVSLYREKRAYVFVATHRRG